MAIVLGAVAVSACTKPQPNAAPVRRTGPAVVATFTGAYDPAKGAFTVQLDPQTPPGALTVTLPWQDGQPTTNPADTLQMRTVSWGTDPTGCGTAPDVVSFWGDIELRSFFRTQAMNRVYAEIIEVTNGYGGCQNAPPVAGVSAGNGLWSYGTLGQADSASPSDRKTLRWNFRYVDGAQFTFRGRIMAELAAPVLSATPAFDWSPSQVVGSRSFQAVATTTAHLVWNGTAFEDWGAAGITMVPVGSPGTFFSMVPGAPYARGLTAGNYFIANAGNGGNAIRTDGDFTVCAKFKPGLPPVEEPVGQRDEKVLVAKGVAQGSGLNYEGWALMQMHGAYCFHYRTLYDDLTDPTGLQTNVMATLPLEPTLHPETFAYDYICGGRSGSDLWVGTSMGVNRAQGIEASTFANSGADLPLVIGAYAGAYDGIWADGTYPARDAGVYEVIVDSRAPTSEVIQGIIDGAEGRLLHPPAVYERSTSPTSYTGPDGNPYVLPPGAVVPATVDGSGLLTPGRVVTYVVPVGTDTQSSGFCLGAEVQADGAWANVAGGLVQFRDASGVQSPQFQLQFGDGTGPGRWRWLSPSWTAGVTSDATQDSWTAGSSHTVKVCVEPTTTSPHSIRLYNDGAPAGAQEYTLSAPADLSNPSWRFDIGQSGTVLTGARIRRVFVCSGPNAGTCL
jgi:hypothetical protein